MNALERLDLSRCHVMGIINATPDSFSDGGAYFDSRGLQIELALKQAHQMVDEGASILDVGGESTRPGAEPVSVQQELDRVIPVIEMISKRLDVAISVDTSTPEVMLAAASAGAHLINDVRALRREGALKAAVESGLVVALMHMQGEPESMQENPIYSQVGTDVASFLVAQRDRLRAEGYQPSAVWLDPGYGFGKTLAHNYELLLAQQSIADIGEPLLVGFSRKSMIGKIDSSLASQRIGGSIALAIMAAERGARIFRVHDVQPHKQALQVWEFAQQG